MVELVLIWVLNEAEILYTLQGVVNMDCSLGMLLVTHFLKDNTLQINVFVTLVLGI